MSTVRFIHTADVHLGSLLQIAGEVVPPFIEKVVEEATLEGFRRVFSQALAKQVDFVLIAGDLYDREARSIKAQEFFVGESKRLQEAGIEVFLIAGNHDPLQEKTGLFAMPSNVQIFPGQKPAVFKVFNREGKPLANIIGQSYKSRWEQERIHLSYPTPGEGLWNIALLHTQLESPLSNYAPCSFSDLAARLDFHYWALGHIHKRQILNKASFPWVAYPGIPQGRHFGEQGRGGSLLVELNRFQKSSITFQPTAPVVYKRVAISLDSDPQNVPATLEDLEERISAKAQTILAAKGDENNPITGYILEWVIQGRGEIHNLIKEQEEEAVELLTSNLRTRFQAGKPFLWTNTVTLRTQGPLDYAHLLENSALLKELDGLIHDCVVNEELAKKLRAELGAIWAGKKEEEEWGTRDDFRFYLDEEGLQDLLGAARQMILEKLAERGELS